MNWLNKAKSLVCILFGIGIFTSCSSDTEELLTENGIGFVSLSIQADAGFQTTRAIKEDDYTNTNNYDVQILEDGEVIHSYEAGKIPSTVKLDAGTYSIKAFYGEDLAASTESMYVVGESEVTLAANETKTAKIVCTPTCAKVTIDFDKELATYFNDYSVSFKTKALDQTTYIWEKEFTDPVYLKVDNNESVTMAIQLTNKEGEQTSQSYSHKLSPKQAFTLHVKPQVKEPGDTGFGIVIEIDEGTNDPTEIEIDIPSNWVDDINTNE